jgi:hypothetical protein
MSLDEKMPQREPQINYISESLPTGLTGTIYGTRVECSSAPRAKNINIVALDRGWTVNVGCSTFAFTDIEDMIGKITSYLKDPQETENLWNQKKLF